MTVRAFVLTHPRPIASTDAVPIPLQAWELATEEASLQTTEVKLQQCREDAAKVKAAAGKESIAEVVAEYARNKESHMLEFARLNDVLAGAETQLQVCVRLRATHSHVAIQLTHKPSIASSRQALAKLRKQALELATQNRAHVPKWFEVPTLRVCLAVL